MRFIAIDPSTTFTGCAVFQDDGLVAWGVIDTRKLQYAERFTSIIDELSRSAARYCIQEIAIEDVKYAWHSKHRNRNISGLQAVFRSIEDWAKGSGFVLTAYNPASWKNAVVGHRAASKETTKENIRLRFPGLFGDLTDHEYDAIAIGLFHAGLKRLERMAE